ncbi:isochorismatase family protein [Chryseobacterium sp.]|jgi:nicotinamidase-related amidase|uniref:isochorismatase family protein n=1 Tax=Chryseobacterium sp. TaxID=1871047 RepID=UPI0028507A81|nr:isochorismatase family protein [Chryseobacterium sp.]MDR3024954.1 isochorismatase family protein [Chryseobacterium sp.]
METPIYERSKTALLFIDPYNDFLSEGGKVWPRVKEVAHVIAIGLLANTCVESTARFAMELGYHVTLVKDATAAFTPEMMHAAHVLNGPTYAHALPTTHKLITALPAENSTEL